MSLLSCVLSILIDDINTTKLWWVLILILGLRFSVNSLLSFYIFFELGLIPILTIILYHGTQPERLSAGLYFIIYTIIFSIPFVIFGLLLLGYQTFFIKHKLGFSEILLIILITPFLVKIPILGIHF